MNRRWAALALIAGLLLAGGLLDRIARPVPVPLGDNVESQIPIAAPAAAGSSAWFCAGATAAPNGAADGTVVVANTTADPLRGTATVIPAGGVARTVPLTVGPLARGSLRLADVAGGPWASAIVELDGGGAVVDLATTGPLGESVTPCASSASAAWYFAEGATTKDANLTLAVLNPFPDDAVVDFVFSTTEGQVTPPKLTGVTVAGRSMLAVNVNQSVERRDAVASVVRARTGRLAVGRLQTWDGTSGRRGVTVATGAAAPGPAWYFPEGMVAEGLSERFHIFNPAADEAEVEVTLALESGSAEPLTLRVPARSRLTLSADEETRIPRGVAHAVTVTANNDVDVVVERTIDGASPALVRGSVSAFGARLGATAWATAAGGAEANVEELIVVQNLGDRPERVDITGLADGQEIRVEGLQGLEIPARSRRAIRMGDHLVRPATPLVIRATAPVVVERGLHRRNAPAGSAMSMAIPLR